MADDAVIVRGSDRAHRDEADAGVATTPGMLVEHGADGDYDPHGTADGPARAWFAGMSFDPNKDKNDDIAVGERFYLWRIPKGSGVVVDALVAAGAGAITEGDYLASNGDGTVRAYTGQAIDEGGTATYTVHGELIVGVANEDLDNSAGTEAARIEVEV